MESFPLKAFLFAILSFVLLILVYLWTYLGAWKTPEISVKEKPPAWILGKPHIGAYHGVSKIIEAIESEMLRQGSSCPKSFGEFLDDPDLVEEIRLRSRAGCWYDTLPPGLRERPLPKDWFLEESPPRKAILARFSGAPSIGPMKVYPAVLEFAERQSLKLGRPIWEVYEIRGPREIETHYWFPIEEGRP